MNWKSTTEKIGASLSIVASFVAMTLFIVLVIRGKGDVLVSTNPSGAQIFVDGQPQGHSPAKLELARGQHRIRVELKGYEPMEQLVESKGAGTENFNVQFVAVNPTTERLAELIQRIGSIEARLSVAIDTSGSSKLVVGQVASQVQALAGEVKGVEDGLRAIRDAIEDSPEKSLSLPLLRKDLESARSDAAAVRSEVDRVIELGKWFVGVFALGLIGIVVTVIAMRK